MKKILLALITTIAVVVGFKNIYKKSETKNNIIDKKNISIAIMTPTTHPSLEKIELGFRKTLEKETDLNFKFTTYNANGSMILMRSQAEEIVNNQFDLIFTLGVKCTQMAKKLTTKKQKLIPIVFGAVARPEKLNLVESAKSSGNHLTGIIETIDYRQQIDLLLKVKPNTKNVLLVYNPFQGAGLEEDKKIVKNILKEKNINLKTIEVLKTNEIQMKISAALNNIDVVMVLKDSTVVPGIDNLVKICNRKSITLLTTDLDSAKKGAALSFGVEEINFGIESAKKALLILKNNMSPSQILVEPLTNFKLIINTQTMVQQGLNINPNALTKNCILI